MSDDEGTNAARDVPAEDTPDGDVEESPTGDVDEEQSTEDARKDASETAPVESEADDVTVAEAVSEPAPSTTDRREESGDAESVTPETSEDVEDLLDRLTRHDDALAREVNAIVETARERNATVTHQREELDDLDERIDEQAETIGDLQATLEEREQELERRAAELEAREHELEERDEQIEELKTHVKRTKADFQNYKKRTKRQQEQLKTRATEDLVTRLVGVRDNLKRALGEESEDVESLREGLEMTMREFDRVLEDENVTEVDPEPGTDVDPQRHEVMVQIDSEQPEGTIADVFTPGYEMGEKVIQSAQVTVSNGALAEEPAGDEDGSDSAVDDADERDEDDASRETEEGVADGIVDDEMFTADGAPADADESVGDVADADGELESDGPVDRDEDAAEEREGADADESAGNGTDEGSASDDRGATEEPTDESAEAIELGGEVESSTDNESDR